MMEETHHHPHGRSMAAPTFIVVPAVSPVRQRFLLRNPTVAAADNVRTLGSAHPTESIKESIMKIYQTIIAATVTTLLAGPVLAQMDMSSQGKPQGGMDHNSMSMTTAADKGAVGTGTVKKVDPAKHTVNLSHGPIPAINWPAMTMDFPVAPEVNLGSVKAGQSVEFTLAKVGSNYTVTSIKPSK